MKKGIYFAFITAVISGFSVFFSSFAAKAIRDPFVLTTSRNLIVALILCGLMLGFKNRRAIKALPSGDWLKLVLIGMIGGSIPFLLFFKGLSMTSPLAGGFIHKTIFVWVSVLAVIFLGERIGKIQWGALAFLLAGNYLLGAFDSFKFGSAESMILAATIFWAIEYVIAKKVLARLDAQIVAWARMFFGAIILAAYLVFTRRLGAVAAFDPGQISWTLFGAALLFGYVSFWYRSLKLAPASVVTSVLVLSSPLTTLLTGLFVTHRYGFEQVLGIIFISAGIALFLVFRPKIERPVLRLEAKIAGEEIS